MPGARSGGPVLVLPALLAAVALQVPVEPGTPAGAEALLPSAGEPDVSWTVAEPGYDWSFPRDHFTHPGYRNEWWYVTGHLTDTEDPERRFGFQLTLFRVGLAPARPDLDSSWAAQDLVLGHAALGDLAAGRHRFSEVLYRAIPLLGGFPSAPGPRVAWSRGPAGTAETWSVAWNGAGFDLAARDRGAGFGFRLTTTAERPLVFQGQRGYSRKAADGSAASLYYSFTRLAVHGEVEIDGQRRTVTGRAWADREFGSGQLARHQSGWDWFSLQLADGRDLMLYVLRDEQDRVDHGEGLLVAADGAARTLSPPDWRLRATGSWTSAASGARYPSGWEIELPGDGLRLRVVPELAAQENVSARTGLAYWEGAVRVETPDGRPAGLGYVELTGYGEANRPAL